MQRQRPFRSAVPRASPGHNRPVSHSQPRSFERQLYSENCRMTYFGTSANADLGHVAKNGRQCGGDLPFSR